MDHVAHRRKAGDHLLQILWAGMTTLTAGSQPATRSQIAAWALWDCGATGLNAIAVTFTFSVYLTSSVGGDDADVSAASWLGYAMAIAGVVVAFFAPIAGVWADDPGRRRFMLFVFSGACTALTAAMALIRDDPAYLLPGLVLLALTAACCDLAAVPYNAMLRQLTTPQTVGRVSGLGSAAGFIGTVVLLLVVFLGFVDDDGGSAYGLLGLPGDDGQHVRAAMLLTAAWFALFALPVLLKVPNPPTSPDVPRQRLGLITGREGMAFGLFMTTGRAASFLSPLMFATFIGLFGADRAGIVGLGVVLIVGLVAMLFVRTTAAKARQPV
jgi:MFS-type transporter involved in bile tolerance (Atg22 family)